MSLTAFYERRRAKLKEGFTRSDLEASLRKKIAEDAKIVQIKKGVWTQVENTWILLKSVAKLFDDEIPMVVFLPHKPFLNWLQKPIASFFRESRPAYPGKVIPNTNVLIATWYVGDGSDAIVLAAKSADKAK